MYLQYQRFTTFKGKDFYICTDGNVYWTYSDKYDGSKSSKLTLYNSYLGYYSRMKLRRKVVKINSKEYPVKNLVIQYFTRGYKKNDVIQHKDGDITNCALDNLVVIPRKYYGKKTGGMRKKIKIGLYENNKLIKTYNSTVEAAKDLYISQPNISRMLTLDNSFIDIRILDREVSK